MFWSWWCDGLKVVYGKKEKWQNTYRYLNGQKLWKAVKIYTDIQIHIYIWMNKNNLISNESEILNMIFLHFKH